MHRARMGAPPPPASGGRQEAGAAATQRRRYVSPGVLTKLLGEYSIWRLLVFAPKVLRFDLMAMGRVWSAACKRPFFTAPGSGRFFETA